MLTRISLKSFSYFIFLFSVAVLSGCALQEEGQTAAESFEADVIVYGGTSAAVTAAVQVSRMGKSVIMVSPDKHLGGLSSAGLGYTDTGNKEVIGGLAREFYHKLYLHYDKPESWKWQQKSEYGNKGQGTPAIDGTNRTMWIFEPHAAEQVFEDFVAENDIEIYRDEWLDREDGVIMDEKRIASIATLSGKIFKGKMFIDATYEGDLMAAANVRYHVGREATDVYNEQWNGVQKGTEGIYHRHYFKHKIDPYKVPGDPSSGLLPRISPEDPGEDGSGDNKIQAYCFRMCFSTHPENKVPFPRPEGYDSTQYELLARLYAQGWDETFEKVDSIPNWKTDTNNHGPFGTDNIGMNYDYPEASYERRREIIAEHELYQKGLMYFLANDPRVPEDVQEKINLYGLAKDEFKDNGNWPHQLYIREARRMIGDYVMTENEVLARNAVPRPVGMGSYTLDSHHTQRYVTKEGYVQNEGIVGVKTVEPYSISYGSLIPKKEECENLLVPVCVSSSHIAYGSIRMEPVFMILGQSAATAAALSIDREIAVQDLDYAELKSKLREDDQRLALGEMPKKN